MKRLTPLLSAALALSVTLGSVLPTMAVPLVAPAAPAASTDIVQVQSRKYPPKRFERRGNNAYYNGQRGYRDYRRGYRQYNGYWFPAGAFIAGAIIGGAIAAPPPQRQISGSHVQWCYDRWRSYRAYDNSYQPSYGPRRVCVSPYG